ncbi:MAG: hypothetical protein WKF73_22415 [Nocardioidaceae bacterium]
MTRAFSPAHVDDVTLRIEGAIERVATAMQRAGYEPVDYRIVVQNYPSPFPPGKPHPLPRDAAGSLSAWWLSGVRRGRDLGFSDRDSRDQRRGGRGCRSKPAHKRHADGSVLAA